MTRHRRVDMVDMRAPRIRAGWNRRSLVGAGIRCLALASLPPDLVRAAEDSAVRDADPSPVVDAIVRPQTLFAGIRKPIISRAELEPRIARLEKACAGRVAGPLTLIFRFDTPVDERCLWVAASIERLKACTTVDQQYDILSRLAVVRPPENIVKYKAIYDRERSMAFCFCSLVREATDPRIDPIFCYDPAGWARQLWEPVLGVELSRCTITHSILKGDAFCAWDCHLV
jgi:hypothetical protein